MLLQPKDYYRKIAPPGWVWVGGGDYDYTHIFQTGDYKTGFKVLECSEDCLTNGNLEFMAQHSLSCTKPLLKKLSKQIAKRLASKE